MIEVGLPIFLRIMSALVLFWSSLHFLGTWITFRIVNFILLIILAVYFFRTHLLVWINGQIKKRDDESVDLHNQKKLLKQQVQELEQQTINQEKKIEAVRVKIRQWQARFEQYKNEADQMRDASAKRLVARRDSQRELLCKKKYNQSVVPRVLKKVRDQLKHDFKDEKNGKAYLAKMITLLQGDEK